MSKYIEDLTKNLIGNHNFEDSWLRIEEDKLFIQHVGFVLFGAMIHRNGGMKGEALGRIMFELEHDELPINNFRNVVFDGNTADYLRGIVAVCLSHKIMATIEKKFEGTEEARKRSVRAMPDLM